MLRDVLSSLPGFATWPCDEINLIWRHGNRDHPPMSWDPELASRVGAYIRSRFDHIRERYDARTVVEDLCELLAVEFVRQLFPKPGSCSSPATVSTPPHPRWATGTRRSTCPYTAAKAKFVPTSDLPYLVRASSRDRLVGPARTRIGCCAGRGPRPTTGLS